MNRSFLPFKSLCFVIFWIILSPKAIASCAIDRIQIEYAKHWSIQLFWHHHSAFYQTVFDPKNHTWSLDIPSGPCESIAIVNAHQAPIQAVYLKSKKLRIRMHGVESMQSVRHFDQHTQFVLYPHVKQIGPDAASIPKPTPPINKQSGINPSDTAPSKSEPIQTHRNSSLISESTSEDETNAPKTSPTQKKICIVIDPGHGGHDPGAIHAALNVKEKDVVLNIGKQLKRLIEQDPNMKAVMTRETDRFVMLRDRLRLARQAKGQILISIHADASPYAPSVAKGAHVFALSLRGATSEAARWLAKQENESISGIAFKNRDRNIQSILVDIAQSRSIERSLCLGKLLVQQFSKHTQVHRQRVEQAGFLVLKSPDICSILIETGFLSHPDEAILLRTASYQAHIAQAIYLGLKEFIQQYPLK